jgi:hypothetical protein
MWLFSPLAVVAEERRRMVPTHLRRVNRGAAGRRSGGRRYFWIRQRMYFW